jgi:hypothetical protein
MVILSLEAFLFLYLSSNPTQVQMKEAYSILGYFPVWHRFTLRNHK